MRRPLLVAGFLLLCLGLFLALALRCGTWRLDRCTMSSSAVAGFADCRERGFPLTGSGAACVLPDGTELLARDRVTLSAVDLPFSFSYPGTLTKTVGKKGQVAVLKGDGLHLEVLLVSRSGSSDEALRAAFPEAFTGSLSVVRSTIDPRHIATIVLPAKAAGTGSVALGAVPLRPPHSHGGRLYDFVLFRGSVSLLQDVVASLAFAPPKPPSPRNFIDPIFAQ